MKTDYRKDSRIQPDCTVFHENVDVEKPYFSVRLTDVIIY
jgi:hypothetical protein